MLLGSDVGRVRVPQDALNLHRLALQTKLQLTEDAEEVPDVKTLIQVGPRPAACHRAPMSRHGKWTNTGRREQHMNFKPRGAGGWGVKYYRPCQLPNQWSEGDERGGDRSSQREYSYELLKFCLKRHV